MGIENRSAACDLDGIRGKIRRVDSVRFQRSLSSFVLPQTQRPGMISSRAALKYAKSPFRLPAMRADFAAAAAREASEASKDCREFRWLDGAQRALHGSREEGQGTVEAVEVLTEANGV